MALKKAKCLDCQNEFYFNDTDEMSCVKCGSTNTKKKFFSSFSTKEKSSTGQLTKQHIEETREMLEELKKEKWK